jgi:hypothetical protein
MRALAALAALLAGCAAAAPEDAPAPELRFRSAGPLDVRFVELKADGAFQFYSRARFTTVKGLAGTWRRTAPDALALRCERWSRQVVVDGLRVRFGSAWEAQRPRVREALAAYLNRHPDRADFARDELEEVGCWSEERDLPGGRDFVTVIPIAVDGERATRSALEALLAALDAYGREGDPHEVHARLHRHRGTEFLEWLDWSGYADPVPVADVKAAIERLEPGEQLADVWTALGPREWNAELWQGERFRFYKTPKPVR